MRPNPTTRGALPKWSAALFLLPLLLAASPAFAQDPVVTAADPNQAEQETFDLVVKISGSNFGTDSQVDFFVAGTTNPGGIHVKSVKRKNPKTLEATIDVAPDAAVELFDIQVRSNGRTGKGTELFRVLVKTTGNDTTPPGDVSDLAVTEIGFNSAYLEWSAPADDGYAPASGPVAGYVPRLSLEGPLSLESWDSGFDRQGWGDPPREPGATQRNRQVGLIPETTYWAAVRSFDDAPQGGNWSGVSNSPTFTTAPAPSTLWVEERIDTCDPWPPSTDTFYPYLQLIDFELDLDGRPALLYQKYCAPGGTAPVLAYLARWTGTLWSIEELPSALSSGDWDQDLAFDPQTGEATMSVLSKLPTGDLNLWRRTASGWVGELVERRNAYRARLLYVGDVPYVAYFAESKNRRYMKIAHREGAAWTAVQFEVAAANAGIARHMWLATDDAGHPAVAYHLDTEGDALGFSWWTGSGWIHETVETSVGNYWVGADPRLAWDPARGDFSLSDSWYPEDFSQPVLPLPRIRICDRTGGARSCADVAEDRDGGKLVIAPDGTARLAITDNSTLFVLDRPPGGSWPSPEYVAWDNANNFELRLDPFTGEPALAYFDGNGRHGSGPNHPAPAVVFARKSPVP